jgi:pyruvate formate lyase activating enzyme
MTDTSRFMPDTSCTRHTVVWDKTGVVFDIQRYSLEDGPGIRTSVFLKGCPLSCPWCSNPESKNPDPELAYFAAQCRWCFRCVEVCQEHALSPENKTLVIHRERCNLCGECTVVCSSGALNLIGERMSVLRVMQEVLRDKPFYQESGGGVTITGGEPLSQADFTAELLKACRYEKVGTAIETSGYGPWESMKQVLEQTDIVLYDLKLIDPRECKQLLGATGNSIIENLGKIDTFEKDIYIRLPLIPGYTDSLKNLEAIVKVIQRLKHCIRLDILPFHQYGKHKYRGIGSWYGLENREPLRYEDALWAASYLEKRGIPVKVFGE